ncbi:MAG: fibronectin type III domain-containing protein [Myxococcota bacterium]
MVSPIRNPRGGTIPTNEFDTQIKQKLAGDNTVTKAEAQELTRGWGMRQLTPAQAEQLKTAVQGNKSTFDAGASSVMSRFVNVTLPTITVRQGLGGVPPNSAKLAWDPPTRNQDGTPLTDLKGYEIHYGPSPGNYTRSVTLNDPAATSFQIDNLPSGTWYFALKAVDTSGNVSTFSNEASKTIP